MSGLAIFLTCLFTSVGGRTSGLPLKRLKINLVAYETLEITTKYLIDKNKVKSRVIYIIKIENARLEIIKES